MSSESFESADKGLKKEMSFTQLLLLGVSAQIGSGWLFSVLAAAGMAGPAAILSWIIASVLIFLIALTYLELGSMLPRSGGIVRYTYLTHGSLSGWIIGWAYWISVVAIPALEAVAALTYIGGKWPQLGLLTKEKGVDMLTWPTGIVAGILLMVFFFCLNYFGSKLLAESNKWVTIWKIALPTITFILLFFILDERNFSAYGGFIPEGWAGVFHAIPMTGIVFSLLGFRQALDYGGESKNPKKDVPRATFGSILIPTIIYVFLQIAFIGAISWSSMGLDPGKWDLLTKGGWADGPLFHALESANIGLLVAFGVFLLIDAAVSPLATGWVYLGTGARTGYGLSIHKSVPKIFSKNNKYGIPWVPLVISAAVGCVFFVPAPSWYKLVGFISSAAVLTYLMGGIGLPVLRKTAAELDRPFRLRNHKFLSLISFLAAAIVLYWSGFETMTNVFTVTLIGLPIYSLYDARKRGWISMASGIVISAIFLVLFIYVAAASGWVLNPNLQEAVTSHAPMWSFSTYYLSFSGLVIGYFVALWFVSNKEGRKHVNATWWLVWLMLISVLIAYFSFYGPYRDAAPIIFPWGSVIELGAAIIAYYIGVKTGFESDEIKAIVKAETTP